MGGAGIDKSHIRGGDGDAHANIGQGSARLVRHAAAEDRGLRAGGLLARGGRLARLFRIGGEGNDQRNGDKSGDERGTQGTQTIRSALGQHADPPG